MTTFPILTSENYPLRIDALSLPARPGRIGLTMCPGRCQDALSGVWRRNLRTDLQFIRNWPASVLVTLIEDHEFERLNVVALGQKALELGLVWQHLPIRDGYAPEAGFEAAWQNAGPDLHDRLAHGENIVLHCAAGVGRAGTVAARLLLETGVDAGKAIEAVRAVRAHALETLQQQNYIYSLEKAGRKNH